MLKLSLVVPDATTNYIENPNSRYDTTGYNSAGATLTRSLDFARFGIASCKVATTGSALREGVYYRVNALSGISDPITASVYVIGTGKVRARLIDNPRGKEWSSKTVTLRADRWTRLSATGVITGSNDVRLYVETNEGSAKARTFYVGGLQMERKAYMTTFCDGDQPGCRWNGLYHGSSSQRAGDTRAGGRWVVIGGPERESEDLYMTVVGGLGAAGITNNTQSFALEAGSFFQNKKITDRIITLTFHAKHKTKKKEEAISLAALHQLRQLLLDVVKPDLTGGDEDILFEYDDGELPLYFKARYEGGLEGDWDVRNQWINSFPLRLLATSPLVYEDQQVVKQLDFQNSLSVNYVMGRLNGVWSNLNSGVNGFMGALALGPKGQIYLGGTFSVINNSAGAVSPLQPGVVAYWNGERWIAIATSIAGGGADINAIAVAPNGDVYVGGDFTSINGVAANYIAKYTQATGLWTALGTGMNGIVYTLAISFDGQVYAGGDFTTAGGVNCYRIARWDGLQWRRLGQYGGLNSTVETIAITKDGARLYVGGSFQDEQGFATTNLNRVAQYNTATGLFSAMGSGFTSASATVHKLFISEAGIVYAGGRFTASGLDTINNIAQWNGIAWMTMGSGMDQEVYDISEFSNGNLVIVGEFNNTGNIPLSKIALWNGSTWTLFDNFFNVSATSELGKVLVTKNTDDAFFAIGSNTGTAVPVMVSGITSLDNTGSTEVRPWVYALGPGTLKWIENQTTKKRLYLDLDILSGEEIFIDFVNGTIESTVRGTLFYAIVAGSDFRSFTLRPGVNQLACFMYNDVSAVMQIGFTPQHWGVDSTQNTEAL